MLGMLLAYDAVGNVLATLDYMVASNETGEVIGLVDCAAHEAAGGRLRDIWDASVFDAPIPDAVRSEVAKVRGVRAQDVTSLDPDHPWRVAHETVRGSGTWPEWIGGRAHDFQVALDAQKRITALVHRASGHRRERAELEAAIAHRIAAAGDEPADIRDLVGGPNAPLVLDEHGRSLGRSALRTGTPPHLPVIRGG